MRLISVGATIWAIAMAILLPSPFDVPWARALLVFAALVLVPLGFSLVPPVGAGERRLARLVVRLQLPAAALLGAAQFSAPGPLAAALTLPWLAVTALIALFGARRLEGRGRRLSPDSCVDAALVFLVVGGAWAVSDRLGFRPLDFDPVIVLLTAIHFHYAGFVLPLATGLALRRLEGRLPAIVGGGVVAGIPAVAFGISATQLGLPPILESAAAWFLAAAGLGVAGLHAQLAVRSTAAARIRLLWAVGSAALFLSMILAALYGARFFLPLVWLDIPLMRALHGSANAFGFALVVLIAWSRAETGTSERTCV